MAVREARNVRVRIDGIDITPVLRSVMLKSEESGDEISIELKAELQSESGSARRHLKGLQKAKD